MFPGEEFNLSHGGSGCEPSPEEAPLVELQLYGPQVPPVQSMGCLETVCPVQGRIPLPGGPSLSTRCHAALFSAFRLRVLIYKMGGTCCRPGCRDDCIGSLPGLVGTPCWLSAALCPRPSRTGAPDRYGIPTPPWGSSDLPLTRAPNQRAPGTAGRAQRGPGADGDSCGR